MAVYTILTFEAIEALAAAFDLGQLTAVTQAAGGIENSTYFLSFNHRDRGTSESQYVLTIGESVDAVDMAFVATLTGILKSQGLPVPGAIADRNGRKLFYTQGKPAILIPKAAGEPPQSPTPAQCRAIGTTLGQLHQASWQLKMTHTSHRSLFWVLETGSKLTKHLSPPAQHMLISSLQNCSEFVNTHNMLPKAIIHGDLFRDNTLFSGNHLTAVIDFFSAGTGYLLFDLAVTANDWCIVDGNRFDNERLYALLSAYHAIRPLSTQEKSCWANMLSIAALRFWVSRLSAQIFPTSALHRAKDPTPYGELLAAHRSTPQTWPAAI